MATWVGNTTVDASKLVAGMTLRVHLRGSTRTIWRTRLGRYWLRLGAWIMGCKWSLDTFWLLGKKDDD